MDAKAEAEDVPKTVEKIVPMKPKAVRKVERENIPLPEGGARRVQAASAAGLPIVPEPSGRFADFFTGSRSSVREYPFPIQLECPKTARDSFRAFASAFFPNSPNNRLTRHLVRPVR